MKNFWFVSALSLAVGSSVLAKPVWAETSGFELNAALGHYFFENDRDLDNDPFWGLGVGYAFNPRWTVEAWFTDANLETEFGNIDVDGQEYRVDALYHLKPENGITPYIVAGIGDMTYDARLGDVDETRVNIGLGLKKALTDRLNLRGDFRLFNSLDHEMTDTGFQVALNYSLGGARPAAQPSLDSDGDGVLDASDRCPNTPAGVAVDVNGCPLDTDGDGVYDYQDDCPDTLANLAVDERGCPIPLTETVSVELNIHFDFDSAVVKPAYENELKKLASFMASYPDTRVEIQGHTDSQGSESYNQRLSQKRADAVAKVLTERFSIASGRISPVGYGESRPVADNSSEQGREANRRVIAEIGAEVETLKAR